MLEAGYEVISLARRKPEQSHATLRAVEVDLMDRSATERADTEMFRSIVPKDSEREKALAAAIPVKRLGRSADVARAVMFFCDRANGFVTGQTLYICGGASVGMLAI